MKKITWNILIAIDQLGNTILPLLPYPLSWPGVGYPDETISSTLGKLKSKHGGKIPWRWPAARIIDWALEKIDPNHSFDAIEADEGENDTENRTYPTGHLPYRPLRESPGNGLSGSRGHKDARVKG